MIKGDIYIQPRQTGKTTSFIYQLINTSNVLMLVNTNKEAQRLSRQYFKCSYHPQILPVNGNTSDVIKLGWVKSVPCELIEYVLIDEYLFYTNEQKELVNRILYMLPSLKKVVVKTTPDKCYDENLIKTIRFMKENNIDSGYLLKDTEKVTEYFDSLLTEPGFTIHLWMDEHKKYMSKDVYKMQVLGELYEN